MNCARDNTHPCGTPVSNGNVAEITNLTVMEAERCLRKSHSSYLTRMGGLYV